MANSGPDSNDDIRAELASIKAEFLERRRRDADLLRALNDRLRGMRIDESTTAALREEIASYLLPEITIHGQVYVVETPVLALRVVHGLEADDGILMAEGHPPVPVQRLRDRAGAEPDTPRHVLVGVTDEEKVRRICGVRWVFKPAPLPQPATESEVRQNPEERHTPKSS